MPVGIDKINFFTPNMYISMNDLALARHEDPNKYLIGIGQKEQSVIPVTQDAVTMAANAAYPIALDDKDNIDLIIFGTESGVDNSKSAAIYLQNLLKLNSNARAFEIKQACYGATAGIQMAREYVTLHPDKKALVVGSDVARYGLNTPGEVTQGGGAVAMIISSHPKLLAFEGDSSFHSEDIMDFWRPLNKTEALVDGHYSNNIYVDFFQKTWQNYKLNNNATISDFKAFVFHLPYVKMGIKGLRSILQEADDKLQTNLKSEFDFSKIYNEQVGNLYTGSLYLSLLSLLNNSKKLNSGDRIGLFSYGSGAQGEFFAMTLQPNFSKYNNSDLLNSMLKNRKQISISQYEGIFNSWTNSINDNVQFDVSSDHARFVLSEIKNNQRIYLERG
ncbi:hydroxymethylglutaryl-CoA synthase [Apilactobacillus sp. M161]|uniref:Hydroxymethylglutaryl-CoA synthase n=1 Tax=Apilactobacillus xinyiensis TaxID=2841032 RepID=A0ABT0HZJ5_9LACO|nr:hydroxymethylglutaryl-CoA synthase [Apilactobacillus xinyiensis]MCK8624008.1 hydroxymethylglutaryl-CoA synthase [Apilactobacillus xinyiensis]